MEAALKVLVNKARPLVIICTSDDDQAEAAATAFQQKRDPDDSSKLRVEVNKSTRLDIISMHEAYDILN